MVPKASHENIANQLLLALPKASLTRLQPALELHITKRGDVITRVDQPVGYHYFPDRGLISLVKVMGDGRSVEIGVVGIEGISNAHALIGTNRAPTDGIVQIPGSAFRIAHDRLRRVMAEDDTLRLLLERYAHFTIAQLAQTAACNRLHYIEERCCRWLLIAHDAARSDVFQLTQEFLAMMLGVQRSGVSIAANYLQKAGLIRYSRGQVTIANRDGLEDAACECYAAMRMEFDKVIRSKKRS